MNHNISDVDSRPINNLEPLTKVRKVLSDFHHSFTKTADDKGLFLITDFNKSLNSIRSRSKSKIMHIRMSESDDG